MSYSAGPMIRPLPPDDHMGQVQFISFFDRPGQLVGIYMGFIEIDIQIAAQAPVSPEKPWPQPGITTDQLPEALNDRAGADPVPSYIVGKGLQKRRDINSNTLQNRLSSLFLAI